MSILTATSLRTAALWQQGDMRDPLGVWGAEADIVADGTGGDIQVSVVTELEAAAAYVYTVYDAFLQQETGALNVDAFGLRIFTNWPNIEQQAGVNPYVMSRWGLMRGDVLFSTDRPIAGLQAEQQLITPNMRFIPIFDPRGLTSTLTIAELRMTNLPDAGQFSFSLFGYYWDRSVMRAPGGIRHPGSN